MIYLHLRNTSGLIDSLVSTFIDFLMTMLIDPLLVMLIDSLVSVAIVSVAQEYIQFGLYGCQADCGAVTDLTQVQVDLVPD